MVDQLTPPGRLHDTTDVAVLQIAGLGVPRRAENFPLAWLCGRRRRQRRLAVYRYCRLVDDLGDELAPALVTEALDAAERELYAAARGRAHHPVFAALIPLLRDDGLPLDPFLRLIEANRVDQRVTDYESWGQLDDYCRLSAAPVGEIVLRLEGITEPRALALAGRVCAGLQLVNHWQDLVEDARRGRCYVPGELRRRHGVEVDHLARGQAVGGVAAMVAECVAQARDRLAAGPALVAALRGRLRLEVAAFVTHGEVACDTVAAAGPQVLRRRPTPRARARLRAMAAAVALAAAPQRWTPAHPPARPRRGETSTFWESSAAEPEVSGR